MSEGTTTGTVQIRALASEIFRLIEEDGLKSVANFSELHDHVDANDYIIQAFETTFGREIEIGNENDEAFVNAAIEQVNELLGGHDHSQQSPDDEVYWVDGCVIEHGRCDTCGEPCDEDGCTSDRQHVVTNI